MKPILVPITDVNSETGVITAWHAADRSEIAVGDPLAEVETSKAIIDVEATETGLVLHGAPAGNEIQLSEPIARVFATMEELERFVCQLEEQRARAADGPRASAPARGRAEELGVDLDQLSGEGLITVEMVEAAAASRSAATADLPDPIQSETKLPRIAVVGAGLGATQVIDILRTSESGIAVAIVDDDPSRWCQVVMDVPVVGGIGRLTQLFKEQQFDAAVISISTSVAARTRLRETCADAGIPLTNAIDPTARITADVSFGVGNVVCAYCHFGVDVRVGDNNFLSAYNSFDHHSELGSDISTGPACATSGLVKIGNRVRLGTGIYIEPYVELGDDVEVASGSVIVSSVPAGHAVKRHVVPTVVVPKRGGGASHR